VSANRENNVRSGFSRPLRPTARLAWESALRPRWLFGMFLRTLLVDGMPHFENMGARIPLITRASRGDGERDRLAWTHLELMRRLWKGRLVLKGILDPDDARIARESGVDGVIVSNHGGRQLDGALAPLRALPAVVAPAFAPARSATLGGPLTLEDEGAFFVGGKTVTSNFPGASLLTGPSAPGRITVNQMYVHYRIPSGKHGAPFVMVHGANHTG